MPAAGQSLTHWPLMPGVVLRERVYDAGVIERHSHLHTTLIQVLEGEFQEEYDGRRIARRPGELHLLPGGIPHSTIVQAAGARVFLVGLYDEWLDRSVDRRLAVARPVSTPRGSELAELGRRMYHEFHARDAAAGLSLEGLLLETLGVLLRRQSTPPAPDLPPWLAQARERLRDEFAHPPPVSALAAAAGVSLGYFYRAFRAGLQCTPARYVRRIRIQYAKRALRESSESISRIAYAAGFGDQAHLTRCFRAEVGVTPAAYRRLHTASRGAA